MRFSYAFRLALLLFGLLLVGCLDQGEDKAAQAVIVEPEEVLDFDGDGLPDELDSDDDMDGVADVDDAFPFDSRVSIDTDSDGVGNNLDNDDDGDGIIDVLDAFPLDASESEDNDLDGLGDNADTDDDNDGVPDTEDTFPFDATESTDIDSDGIGDNSDPINDNIPTPRIFAVGDSMSQVEWRNELSRLSGYQVVNRSVGGQSSKDIAARMGARPVYILSDSQEIVGVGISELTLPDTKPLTDRGSSNIKGYIDSAFGTLYRRDDGSFYFDAEVVTDPVQLFNGSLFAPVLDVINQNDIAVIWVGRNNTWATETVLLDALRLYKLFDRVTSRIIVLSVTNGRDEFAGTAVHTNITSINRHLGFEFGESYIDVRQLLIDAYDPSDPQSVIDYQQDTTPASLRGDKVHLNVAGNQIIAEALYSYMYERGWLVDQPIN